MDIFNTRGNGFMDFKGIHMTAILLLFVITSVTCCPCRYCGPTTLCHQMNLQEVPYTIPTSNVIRLLLYGNQIKKLSSNEFQGMSLVKELDLHGNQITEVQTGAFKGLDNLESLHLSYNNIEFVPKGALLDMPKLSRLFLDNNKLKRPPGDIPYLSGLTKLNLGRNRISSLQWSSFFTLNRLESVIIWSNPLQCDCNVHELIKWFTTTAKGSAISTDEITFNCTAEDLTEVCNDTKIIKVSHLSSTDNVTIKEMATSSAVYVQNDSARLYCNVSGNPEALIVWRTPSAGYVYPYSNNRLTAHFNGTLVIERLRKSDNGKYSCHPRRSDISSLASKTLEIIVVRGEKPKIEALKDKIQGSKSDELILKCKVSGNPYPDIQWFHPTSDRELIEDNFTGFISKENSKYKQEINGTQITIFEFSEQDAGLWKCRASNSMGFDSAYIQVTYVESDNNLLIIIVAVACAVVGAVIVAVVLVTCVVTQRRRKTKAEMRRQDNVQIGNDNVVEVVEDEEQNTPSTGSEQQEVTSVVITTPENPPELILEQPFTNEPEIRGIRI